MSRRLALSVSLALLSPALAASLSGADLSLATAVFGAAGVKTVACPKYYAADASRQSLCGEYAGEPSKFAAAMDDALVKAAGSPRPLGAWTAGEFGPIRSYKAAQKRYVVSLGHYASKKLVVFSLVIP
jgi:hypothetical protein